MSDSRSSTLEFRCEERDWLLSCHFTEWEDWQCLLRNCPLTTISIKSTSLVCSWQQRIFKSNFEKMTANLLNLKFFPALPLVFHLLKKKLRLLESESSYQKCRKKTFGGNVSPGRLLLTTFPGWWWKGHVINFQNLLLLYKKYIYIYIFDEIKINSYIWINFFQSNKIGITLRLHQYLNWDNETELVALRCKVHTCLTIKWNFSLVNFYQSTAAHWNLWIPKFSEAVTVKNT